jgi:hypothetical protein
MPGDLLFSIHRQVRFTLWFNWGMTSATRKFAWHGWLGASLVVLFWTLNWSLKGLRTQWAFFPLWFGYSLTIDALVLFRTGTSLLTRSWRRYIGLFLVSSPVWWLFELVNGHLHNWQYLGAEQFSTFMFWMWATLNFSTVIPAVLGSSELLRSFLKKPINGPIIRPSKSITLAFFASGWVMLALMVIWPQIFFPFAWISFFFILEPVNIWLGYRSLAEWTGKGNWQPVISLWLGVLLTAFFWEMWNYHSYPKWIYHVGWGNWLHIFEMPLLGYGGYLPFALELFAMYHLIAGLFGQGRTIYVIGKE